MRKLGDCFSLRSLAGIALLLSLSCSGKNKTEDLSAVKPDFSLTAEQFHDEFQKDEKAAGAKYDGKVVELTGVLLVFGPPREGGSGPTFHLLAREAKPIPKFVFCTSADSTPWKKVIPDQTVTIRGRVAGGEVRSCQIIEVKGPPALTLTAAQLAKDSEKYKEKWLIVTGEINKIGTFETAFDSKVILKTVGTQPQVACQFSILEAEEVKGLKVGQQVKILGKYWGKKPWGFLDLDSCILIE